MGALLLARKPHGSLSPLSKLDAPARPDAVPGEAPPARVFGLKGRVARAVREGRIGSDHPDFRQGQLILLNKIQGMTLYPDLDKHEGVEAYEEQPSERHAREVTKELGKFIPVREYVGSRERGD